MIQIPIQTNNMVTKGEIMYNYNDCKMNTQ